MLITSNKRGLCNVIKALVSMLRQDLNGKIYWRNKGMLQCKFSDLFTNDLEIHSIPKGFPKKNRVGGWRFYISKEDKNMLPPGMKYIDFEYERIPVEIKEKIMRTVKILQPTAEISKEVELFSNKFDKKTVSVHVRNWVGGGGKARRERHSRFRIEEYFKVLDKMSDKHFFVASDSVKMIEQLVQRYGKERISFRSHPLNFSREGSTSALIDVLLLSKNKIIVGSHHSTFTEMAWWFGECQANVVRIGDSAFDGQGKRKKR